MITGNCRFDEGPDNQLVHKGIRERLLDRPKFGVPPCKLDGQGGEDEVEIAPVLEVSGAEEGGPKLSVWENPLRDRLRDGGLPRPCQPVQPINWGLVKVPCPEFDLVQNDSAVSLEATPAVAMPTPSTPRTGDTVEDSRFSYRGFASGGRHRRQNMSRPGFRRASKLFRLLGWKGEHPPSVCTLDH